MKRPAKFEEVLGVACMVVLVLLTLGNVLTRYFTDASFAWTEEISIFLIVVMTLAGAASIAARDRHIRIEFLYDGGSADRRRMLRLVSAIATVTYWMYVVGRPPNSGRRSLGMMRLRKKNTITWMSMLTQSEKNAVR